MNPLATLLAPYRAAVAGEEPDYESDPLYAVLNPPPPAPVDSAVHGPAVPGLSALQQRAARLAQKYGWGNDQVAALVELWNRESGWNPSADNPTSSAYGIPQALTELHGLGSSYMNNPMAQIKWGLRYINQRYGSPQAALNFHDQQGYY